MPLRPRRASETPANWTRYRVPCVASLREFVLQALPTLLMNKSTVTRYPRHAVVQTLERGNSRPLFLGYNSHTRFLPLSASMTSDKDLLSAFVSEFLGMPAARIGLCSNQGWALREEHLTKHLYAEWRNNVHRVAPLEHLSRLETCVQIVDKHCARDDIRNLLIPSPMDDANTAMAAHYLLGWPVVRGFVFVTDI